MCSYRAWNQTCNWGRNPNSCFLQATLNLQQGNSTLWQYRLWSFQMGGTKSDRFLPKNQHIQRKLLNFENWGLNLKEISSRFKWRSQNRCTLVGKYGILTKNVDKSEILAEISEKVVKKHVFC